MEIRKFGFGVWIMVAMVVAAVVTFSCDDPPSPGLILSRLNVEVESTETGASLTIEAYLDWSLTVTEGGDWIATPSVTSGTAGTTTEVRFTLMPNGGEKARTGKITVTAVGETDPYYFTITQNSENVLTEVNKWIYESLSGWYYWNSAVKAAVPPDNSLDYEEFLEILVANAYDKGAVDNTENPPTIDGYFVYNNNTGKTDRYFYSYITRTAEGTRFSRGASESIATTFGFDFEPVVIGGTKNNLQLYFLVTWVRSDSPAAEADMKRGTWITKYKGADIYMPQYEQFFYQLHDLQGGTQMNISVDGDGNIDTTVDSRNVALTAKEMTVSPIIHHEVLTSTGGKKVAYLFYNGFERGDNNGSERNPKYEFDEELREVFGEFKTEGATELVLDLRYNPGGYVSSCLALTSLAANVDRSKVFAKMKRNPNINDVWEPVYGRIANPESVNFNNEANSLKLSKIYVLATGDSASASEMVINSLRGIDGIEVIHIGTTTNGKNVGMDLIKKTIDGYDYEMWPITFKILNAKDFTDYAGGFEPQYFLKELSDALSSGGVLYELGDPKERLLKAALTLIDGGTVRPDTRTVVTRTDGVVMQPVPRFKDPRRGGAKYIPSHVPTTEQ